MTMPHRTPIRVYYEDTDFSSFVYHAGYLRFMERGRTEFLRHLGITQSRLREQEQGLVFVVSRLVVDYMRPAFMDDLLHVSTSLIEARGPRVRLKQEVVRETTCLVRGEVDVVAVREGRAVRLPPSIRDAFLQSGAQAPQSDQ